MAPLVRYSELNISSITAKQKDNLWQNFALFVFKKVMVLMLLRVDSETPSSFII